MIKNVFIKRLLQNTVFEMLSLINKHKKHNSRIIMLYSNMGFRDNIRVLYDYIIESGGNRKYQIICSLNDFKEYRDNTRDNVKFVSNPKGILYYFRAGTVYYCFGKLPIVHGNDQEVIQMWHGSPLKQGDQGMREGHSWKRQYYSHVFSASKHFVPIWSSLFSIPHENVYICGHPRCDLLFKANPGYDFGSYQKLILWAPTFRKSKVMGYADVKVNADEIVPVVKPSEFRRLNDLLKVRNVKIVVKLHPMQDLSNYNLTELDQFILMSHDDFTRKKMDLYRLMVQSDALITDYSSIFYDYLLLDRPIGFTEDDFEDYGDTRGWAVDNPDSYRPGQRIKTKEDLLNFVDSLTRGEDSYASDRHRVLKLSNEYLDGGYCKRALECANISI